MAYEAQNFFDTPTPYRVGSQPGKEGHEAGPQRETET